MNNSMNKTRKSSHGQSPPTFSNAVDRISDREMSMCLFGSGGTCCRNCNMGPCQIIDGVQDLIGVCGATADTVAARNFARIVGAGVSRQVEEAREMVRALRATVRGESPFMIHDQPRLVELARLFELDHVGLDKNELVQAVGERLLAEFGNQEDELALLKFVPEKRRRIWRELGVSPRGLDREVVELMHRTHMGVDQEYVNILRQTSRCALADGWGASRVFGLLNDIMFPAPPPASAREGCLRNDKINILIYSQSPLALEALLNGLDDPGVKSSLGNSRARGINLISGAIGEQESMVQSGAVDVLVVGGSCVMPAACKAARLFHTRIVSVGNSIKMAGAEHFELTGPGGLENARAILMMGIAAFAKRAKKEMDEAVEAVKTTMRRHDSIDARGLARQIKTGAVRGIVFLIGCDNYRVHGDGHLDLAEALLSHDILVMAGGCVSESLARAGMMQGDDVWAKAGSLLTAACRELGINPVLSLGQCTESNRLLTIASSLIEEGLGNDFADLPLVVASASWTSEKIVATGQCMVASGITTFFPNLPVRGSKPMIEYLLDKCRVDYGANWVLEEDHRKLAKAVVSHLDGKRAVLDR
ncbi:MAG: carbon monoxide dehydrogenase [Proteobacteria bacterium]|nr:carbon monoxide dehydrogenase [Pseudomonadota bacterium]